MLSHLAVGLFVMGFTLIVIDLRYRRQLKAVEDRADHWYLATQYWYCKFINHIEYLERKKSERHLSMDDDDDDDDDSEEWKKR